MLKVICGLSYSTTKFNLFNIFVFNSNHCLFLCLCSHKHDKKKSYEYLYILLWFHRSYKTVNDIKWGFIILTVNLHEITNVNVGIWSCAWVSADVGACICLIEAGYIKGWSSVKQVILAIRWECQSLTIFIPVIGGHRPVTYQYLGMGHVWQLQWIFFYHLGGYTSYRHCNTKTYVCSILCVYI